MYNTVKLQTIPFGYSYILKKECSTDGPQNRMSNG